MIRVENPRRTQLESQDDLAYLTGRRSAEEVDRQVRYETDRRASSSIWQELEREDREFER